MENSWPYTPTTKPYLRGKKWHIFAKCVHIQTILLESLNNWFCHTLKYDLCSQVTGWLESQLACSRPFLEATAATSTLPHGLGLAFEILWREVWGGWLLTLKEIMVSVLVKGDLVEVRFSGGWPSRNTSKVQINSDFICKLYSPAT